MSDEEAPRDSGFDAWYAFHQIAQEAEPYTSGGPRYDMTFDHIYEVAVGGQADVERLRAERDDALAAIAWIRERMRGEYQWDIVEQALAAVAAVSQKPGEPQ